MVSMAARRLPLLLFAAALLLHPLAPCHASTEDVDAAAARRECTYTVRVKTSCASPARTADTVSVAFGDAYRNEAYGARLPAGASGALERCAVDTFRVGGQCGYGVCYLYLRRAGRDGWAPEWVQVFEPGAAAGEKPSTFYFGSPLPDGVWYGHNRCPKASPAMAARRTNTSASPLG